MFSILRFCFLTRIWLFLFQVIVSLLPDHKADAFIDPLSPPHPWVIDRLFGGFDNWDSQYYLSIAEHKYLQEEFLAFFPLYPLIIRLIATTVLSPLMLLVPFHSVLLISGYLVSNLSFMLATVLLYHLAVKLTSDPNLGLLSSFLFCINPASVFMCSVYTESLFVCLCFAGMLALTEHCPTVASLCFAMATATRSNGIITVGYLLYYHFQQCLFYASSFPLSRKNKIYKLLKQFLVLIVHVGTVLTPFILFQVYSFFKLCHGWGQAAQSGLFAVCTKSLPIPYSYVQSQYWEVGFINYYQFKQIPNFLLALPMICLLIVCFKSYFTPTRQFFSPKTLPKSGFRANCHLFPYVVHGLFMLVAALFFMHIQIITRFVCSSSPLVYLFSSSVLLDFLKGQPSIRYQKLDMLLLDLISSFSIVKVHIAQLILLYFLCYLILGFTMHCNFLPWT